MPIAIETIVTISRAGLLLQHAFDRSLGYWRADRMYSAMDWETIVPQDAPVRVESNQGLIIDGDCSADVAMCEGSAFHVYGSLRSQLRVSDHCEVIVTGDVEAEGRIISRGLSSVFVGGDFNGKLSSWRSLGIWIGGNFCGLLKTGAPLTRAVVQGDYSGQIGPRQRAALLELIIDGYAAQDGIRDIVAHRYTVLAASIGCSDTAAGLYCENEFRSRDNGGNTFSRWSVVSESTT